MKKTLWILPLFVLAVLGAQTIRAATRHNTSRAAAPSVWSR